MKREEILRNGLKDILQGGAIPKIARIWERWGFGKSRRWLYYLTEDFTEERGLNFWQKSKLLVLATNEFSPIKAEMMKADMFAALSEKERLRSLAVLSRSEQIRKKFQELSGLMQTEWV